MGARDEERVRRSVQQDALNKFQGPTEEKFVFVQREIRNYHVAWTLWLPVEHASLQKATDVYESPDCVPHCSVLQTSTLTARILLSAKRLQDCFVYPRRYVYGK